MASATLRLRNGTIVRYKNAQQLVHGLGDFVLVYCRDKQGRDREVAFQMSAVLSTEIVADVSQVGFTGKHG